MKASETQLIATSSGIRLLTVLKVFGQTLPGEQG